MSKLHLASAFTSIYFLYRHCKGHGQFAQLLWSVACATLGLSTLAQLGLWLYLNAFTGKLGKRLTIERYNSELTAGRVVAQCHIALPRGWRVRAGDYIQLTVPSTSLSSIWQTHPFVVCWWQDDQHKTAIEISILMQSRGGFTKRLLHQAESRKQLPAWIQGPFGVSGGFTRQGTVVLLSTGIGIAAHLPHIKELVGASEDHRAYTKRLQVLWEPDDPCKSAGVEDRSEKLTHG